MTAQQDCSSPAWGRSLEAEARLQGNLAVFEALSGDFPYREHSPTSFGLRWDAAGWFALVDLAHGGAPVYDGDPRAWADAQVEAFRRSPECIQVGCRPIGILEEEGSAHILNSNKAMRLLQEVPRELPDALPDSVNLMVMLGCGLGYQIEALLRRTDVRHLCVIEPEADIFHASLHTIDWLPVLQHFSREGRSLELIVGERPEDCYGRLDGWISDIGGFNLVRPYVFSHLVSRKTAESYEPLLQRILPERTSLRGYFDDEQVGIAHTIRNLQAGVPVLRRRMAVSGGGAPALIVANGPSLDDSIEAIRRCRGQMVVMSCGTALGSLMKAGIRPDIHVEMERDSEMREWIEAATTPDDRAAMIVLGLNTVHPDVFALFPVRGMGMKANDLGSAYVADRVHQGGTLFTLDNCNPTVANCATAFAAEMGFAEIYLAGVDFGFPAGEKHHSELSIHYDVRDEHQQALGISHADDAQNIVLEGNFGGLVKTTTLYRRAGDFLGRVALAHPATRFLNLGAGLKIDGTEALRPADLKLGDGSVDTGAVAATMVARAFGLEGFRPVEAGVVSETLSQAAEVLAYLEGMAAEDVESVQEGLVVLAAMHAVVRGLLDDEEDQYVGRILRGSVEVFSLVMALALHHTRDTERNLALYHECRDLFATFCRAAAHKARTGALDPDARTRNLEAILA